MPYVAVSDEDKEALEILAKRDDLTEWEEDFLQALHGRPIWTDRQKEKFDQLWKEKMGI